MIAAMIQGELVADPVERISAKDTPFVTATVRVAAGAEALFIGLACFSETGCERLLKLRKGASVAAAGTLELHAWVGNDGEERKNWRITAAEVLTVYAARKRRESAEVPA